MDQGYIHDVEEISRGSELLIASQGSINYSESAADAAEWDGRPVMLFDVEPQLFGGFLAPFDQRRGTCVGRGTAGAIEDALYSAISSNLIVSRPKRLSWEAIYIHARVVSAENRWRGGDGCAGVDAALTAHYSGVVAADDFPKMTEDQVCDLANGQGIPGSVTLGNHRLRTYRPQTRADLVRALANRCGVAICMAQMVNNPNAPDNRDADGMCFPRWSGGHCTRLRGVYTDHKGRLCYVHGQSWGSNKPGGPKMIKTDEGQIELPPGCCGVFADDVEPLIFSREAWAFQFRDGEGFRPDTLTVGDLINQGHVA